MKNLNPELLVIDLLCGAGGVSEGFEQAEIDGNKIAMVIVGVNHDKVAISSHAANHPETLHIIENFRTANMKIISDRVKLMRKRFPDAKLLLHASLECTNFSKAKGGQARDGDSRTMADDLDRYIIALKPHYITIENVVEFMAWGAIDANGKPISSRNGSDWIKWKQKTCGFGYTDQWGEMNAANFGALTSRNRLFGMFAKPGLPIAFPEPTHVKQGKKVNAKSTLFDNAELQPWQPVRPALDLDDKGYSIFGRSNNKDIPARFRKDLVEATLQRIYEGCIKFVAGGKDAFMMKYNSNPGNGKVSKGHGLTDPSPVLSTQGRLQVVQPQFLSKYYSGKPEHKNISLEGPAGTLKCSDGHAMISNEFISTYHGNGHNCHSVDGPAPTIPTADATAIVNPQFLSMQYGQATNVSIDETTYGLTCIPKESLVTAEPFLMDTNFKNKAASIEEPARTITASRHHHYLINPSWGGNNGDIDKPCCTIVARQDKAPLYLITTEHGLAIEVYKTDSYYTQKLKEFMALYGIIDIKMRMLKVPELLKIQGFPDGYILNGTETDKKKFIGNSVVPLVIKVWAESLVNKIRSLTAAKAA